jgi:hypothetical protein
VRTDVTTDMAIIKEETFGPVALLYRFKSEAEAIKWTRLSCRSFAANAVRLHLQVLAYNLGNFMRTLAMPKTAEAVPGSSAMAAMWRSRWLRSPCRGRCSRKSCR